MSVNSASIPRIAALPMAVLLLSIGLLTGCGSDKANDAESSVSQPQNAIKPVAQRTPEGTPVPAARNAEGSFKATISGAMESEIAWIDNKIKTQRAEGRLSLKFYGGEDDGAQALARLIVSIPGNSHEVPVGTYPLKLDLPNDPSDPNDLAIIIYYLAPGDRTPVHVSSIGNRASGEVVITKSNAQAVSGTFQFTTTFLSLKTAKKEQATAKGSFHVPWS